MTVALCTVQPFNAFGLTGTSYDEMPPAVVSWTAADFKGQPLREFNYDKKVLPLTGQTLHRIKATTPHQKRRLAAAYDNSGAPLADRGRALLRAEKAAWYALHGAVRPRLAAMLPALPAGKAIRVAIWLRTFEPSLPREQLAADPLLAADHKASIEYVHSLARARLMADWPSLTQAFISFQDGAPLGVAWLTRDEILAIAKHPAIARLYRYEEPVHTYSTVWDETIKADVTGVDGSGYEVCVLEGAKPNVAGKLAGIPTSDPYACTNGDTSVASRWIAEIVAATQSPDGAAPGALTPIGNWEGTACSGDASTAINWCSATRSADAWAWPWTCTGALSDLMDYHVKRSPYPAICVSADNGGATSVSSCLGYNVINMGGTDDKATSSRSDDALYTDTSSKNPAGTDRELPLLAAPAVDIETASGTQADGTSAAAAMCAGAAAQLLDKNSSLDLWPEAVRAILMAGADKNVDGTPLKKYRDNIDHKDGTGELNVNLSVAIANSANKVSPGNSARASGFDYDTMRQSDFVTIGDDEIYFGYDPYRAKAAAGGKVLRVVVVWDGTATCTDADDASTCGSSVLDGDFDLKVWDVDADGWAKTSTSYDNAGEVVLIDDPDNHSYEIYIYKWDWATGVTSTYMGIAWHFGDYDI